MAMMGQRGSAPLPAAPPYKAENLAVRLSVKLFNCTPAELPSDLKRQLTGWLKSTPAGAEGYLRPGCVHLTVQAHVPADTASQVIYSCTAGSKRSACSATGNATLSHDKMHASHVP